MLSFDIRSLESNAVQVHGDLAADDSVWVDGDLRPVDGVRVEGRLSVAGEDRFYFSGHITGRVTSACRRCLVDVSTDVSEEVQLLFAPAGDPATEDDPDVFLFEAGASSLDLRPAVREAWLLAVPRFVQCRPECRGLCPSCGTDLNTGTCSCAPVVDHRWDALRAAGSEPPTA